MKQRIRYQVKYIIRKPWLIEAIVFFLVLWQESIRLSLRTQHKKLPVSGNIQDFYYYNFGDFVNGYVIAFIIDGLADLAFNSAKQVSNMTNRGFLKTMLINETVRSISATILSSLIIVAFEIRTSAYTWADLSDIPAGIAGALFFLAVRLFAQRYRLTKKII